MKRIIIIALLAIPFLGYGQLKQVQRGALNNSRAEHAINAGINQTNTNTAGIATNASAISDISVGAFDTTNIVARLDTDSARTDANDAKITNATHSGEVTGSGALTIADDVIEAANLESTNSPTDNYIPSYDLATLGFTWVANEAGSGSGDMSFTDTTAMLAPYPDFTEMRGEISDSLDALLAAGQAGVVLADSTGVAAGTYVTGWDFVAGQALKADLASPTFTGVVTIPSPFTIGSTSMTATAAELNYVDGVTSDIQTQLDDKADKEITENGQTGTTYTLVLGDAGKVVTLTNAASITLTVPPNSSVAFPAGTMIVIEQWGAGVVTVAEGSGVTVNSLDDALDLMGQYATATLRKDATDIWILSGAIE